MKYFTPKKNYEVFYSVRTQYMVWVGELGRNTYVDTYHTYHTHTHTHTHTAGKDAAKELAARHLV